MSEGTMAADHIRDIRRRAEAAGVPMAQILLSAGVYRSTWWRWCLWLEGDPRGRYPRLETLEQIHEALAHHEAAASEGG